MATIVVISGSPRKNGNTEQLADAFIKGANEAGNHVEKFHVSDYKISGCLGCQYCQKHEGQCVQKDDMQIIYDALYRADVIVFATPLYWAGMSGQIKLVIDRLYASAARPFPISSAVLLMPFGATSPSDTDAVVAQYHEMLRYTRWQNKGTLLASGMLSKNDIAESPYLEEAEALGKSFS